MLTAYFFLRCYSLVLKPGVLVIRRIFKYRNVTSADTLMRSAHTSIATNARAQALLCTKRQLLFGNDLNAESEIDRFTSWPFDSIEIAIVPSGSLLVILERNIVKMHRRSKKSKSFVAPWFHRAKNLRIAKKKSVQYLPRPTKWDSCPFFVHCERVVEEWLRGKKQSELNKMRKCHRRYWKRTTTTTLTWLLIFGMHLAQLGCLIDDCDPDGSIWMKPKHKP